MADSMLRTKTMQGCSGEMTSTEPLRSSSSVNAVQTGLHEQSMHSPAGKSFARRDTIKPGSKSVVRRHNSKKMTDPQNQDDRHTANQDASKLQRRASTAVAKRTKKGSKDADTCKDADTGDDSDTCEDAETCSDADIGTCR